MALANLSNYYTWKNIKSAYSNNLEFLPQLGIMHLTYLMDHVLFQTSKNTLNLSLRNTKL